MSVAALLAFLAMTIAGHPVQVICSNDAPPEIRAVPNWVGCAPIGKPVVHLRPRECVLASRGVYWSLFVLAHEVGHSLGLKTEKGADRYARSRTPVLVLQWRHMSR